MPDKNSEENLYRLAAAVIDGRPVDWEDAARALPADRVRRLQALQAMAALSGIGTATPSGTTPPSETPSGQDAKTAVAPAAEAGSAWGPLRLLERLGSGSGGDVFRAFDPALEREVALKLRPAGTIPSDEFLAEARRQARVRHPNVLVVHGAGLWDGRIGLWTDLLRGKSLEECLTQQGTFGAREAALVGIDLCRALAAVHAAGLVHGDVKAANVMREEGGRIVLMDFGTTMETACDSGGPGVGTIRGSPLYLAPERLAGEAAAPSSDVYALGVLLFHLVTSRFPVEAETLAELAAKHARGECTNLREVRPDLPTSFVLAIGRALEARPAARYTSMSAMETALAACLDANDDTQNGSATGSRAKPKNAATQRPGAARFRRHQVLILSLLAVILMAIAAGTTHRLLRFDVDATLYRQGASEDDRLDFGERVRIGDRLFLDIEISRAAHVYVVNEDAHGNAFLLFPLPGLAPRNPLAAGAHRLPGWQDGSARTWEIDRAGGRETILVIVSRQPHPEVEARAAGLALPASDSPTPAVLRGMGRLTTTPRTGSASVPGQLAALEREIQSGRDRRNGVWLRRFELSNP